MSGPVRTHLRTIRMDGDVEITPLSSDPAQLTLELADAADAAYAEAHIALPRLAVLALRTQLSDWLAATAHQLPPPDTPCRGCAGAWAVAGPDNYLRCELCGDEVPF